jgi:membrane-bound metal-dependent hydrolase YbcI (DUF457 family)
VLLWFTGMAVAIVWTVFRDARIDYRLVALGALLPDVADAPLGGPRYAHTLLASAALLVLVMLATRGRERRAARKRSLALPIGALCHLVLDGMWARTAVFWWPFLGGGLYDRGLPSLDRPVGLLVAMELAGAVALWWAYGHIHEARAGARAC